MGLTTARTQNTNNQFLLYLMRYEATLQKLISNPGGRSGALPLNKIVHVNKTDNYK